MDHDAVNHASVGHDAGDHDAGHHDAGDHDAANPDAANPDAPDHAAPVAVLEVDPAGHRLRHVRLLRDHVGADKCLVLVPPAVRDAPEFATHLGPSTRVALLSSTGRRAAVEEALRIAAEQGAERLVIADGDKFVAPLLLALVRPRRPRPTTVSVLLMRTTLPGGSERATVGMALKPFLVAALRLVRGVRLHFLTDAFGLVERRRGFPGIRALRDPVAVPQSEEAPPLEELATPPGLVRVGVFGVVGERKNLPVLLAAVRDDDRLALVIGGRCEPPVRRLLAEDPTARALTAAGRLVVADRLLDEAEFDAALRSVAVVAALYDNDAPSGLLGEACARGVPALGPAHGWAGHTVAGTGIGMCATVDDPADVSRALTRMVQEHGTYVAAVVSARRRLGDDHFAHGLAADRP